MALVTVQVLEGLERGRIFREMTTPVTIGREDENAIQLNDERVSRFHAKMQEDGDDIILTDLESTNGTRVNGHPVKLRVLRPGDIVGIGRCLLLFGSETEIEADLIERPTPTAEGTMRAAPEGFLAEEELRELFPAGPPELPQELSPIQRARLADLLSYAHDQIRKVLVSSSETEEQKIQTEWKTWQQLLSLESALASYLREIADPESD